VERLADRRETLLRINNQLADAVLADLGNARHVADLANWYGELYEALRPDEEVRQLGLHYARTAQKIDPLGKEGYLAESRLHQLGAARAPNIAIRKKSADEVPQPLLRIVTHRPNDTLLHYQLAVALIGAGDKILGKVHASRALELDELAPTPERRLSDAQRRQARRFAGVAGERTPLP